MRLFARSPDTAATCRDATAAETVAAARCGAFDAFGLPASLGATSPPSPPPLKPQQLGPGQLAWLEDRFRFYGIHRKQAEAAPGVAAVASPGAAPGETGAPLAAGAPTPAIAPGSPPSDAEPATPPAVPFVALRARVPALAAPADVSAALVTACRDLIAADEAGRHRTPAINRIRKLLPLLLETGA